ncbi:MAG: CPBP family intramembrane metalloprotease [Clostridia bacterium]|nr:CPBP family intramembrane metalloprotease [Clostridia bacterium]
MFGVKKEKKSLRDKFNLEDAFKCFFFLIVVVSLVALMYQIVLVMVASNMGVEYKDLYYTPTVQIISTCVTPVTFILYFFIYNKINHINTKLAVKDEIKKSLLPISVAMVLSIISIFLITPFVNLCEYIFILMGYIVDTSVPLLPYMMSSPLYLFIGIIIYALLPAIAEELIFRGTILRGLNSKYGAVTSILVTSILFTLAHGSASQTIYQLLMGVVLGYLALVGGSILYSFILHFLNNTLVVLITVFNVVDYLNMQGGMYYANFWQVLFPIMLFLLAICLILVLFWVLKYLRNVSYFTKPKKNHKKDKDIVEDIPQKNKVKNFWKDTEPLEKVYFVAAFMIAILMWIINTSSGFMG